MTDSCLSCACTVAVTTKDDASITNTRDQNLFNITALCSQNTAPSHRKTSSGTVVPRDTRNLRCQSLQAERITITGIVSLPRYRVRRPRPPNHCGCDQNIDLWGPAFASSAVGINSPPMPCCWWVRYRKHSGPGSGDCRQLDCLVGGQSLRHMRMIVADNQCPANLWSCSS